MAGLPDAAMPNGPIHAFAREHLELANDSTRTPRWGWLGLIQLNCTAGMPVVRAEMERTIAPSTGNPFRACGQERAVQPKEMSIAGTICLSRPDMQILFSAAFSNPTVSPSVLAMLYSWYADYLLLREDDLMAAQGALARSLQLTPANPSNRLKWAQLVLLDGRRDEAAQLLKALGNAQLSSSEKRTATKLLACLEGDSTQCGKI